MKLFLTGYKGFRSLHPWPSGQDCAHRPPALFLLQGIRRAAPAQVTACRVVTLSDLIKVRAVSVRSTTLLDSMSFKKVVIS